MNAIQLLREDHKQVKQLLSELEATTPRAVKKRTDLLLRIKDSLDLHSRMEEEIFYPAFRQAAQRKEDKLYFEALEEHRAVDDLVMPDLLATDPGSEKFSGRAKVLRELIEHHIKEEEQQMFKKARALLDNAQLRELGRQMIALKQDVYTSAADSTTASSLTTSDESASVSVIERAVDVGQATMHGALATVQGVVAAASGKGRRSVPSARDTVH